MEDITTNENESNQHTGAPAFALAHWLAREESVGNGGWLIVNQK
jgi:hypothetical protein